jgi:hypothetical protein
MGTTLALSIGLLAGAHTSTWGMFKDAPHEGFTYAKYARSILLAVVVAIVAHRVSGLDLMNWSRAVVFFGMVYVIERAITEFWKTFLRVEDQSKYFIPMQFHVKGSVVHDRKVQLLAGAGWLTAVLLIVYGITWAQRNVSLPPWVVIVAIGGIGGWISAFGGAWKDAPVEGFETFKFFRSPGIAAFFALLLACFTDNWLYLALAAEGYTVATIETYKTFFHPNKPRGKWAGKSMPYEHMLKRRWKFVPLYVLVWLLVITGFVLGYVGPHRGLLCP